VFILDSKLISFDPQKRIHVKTSGGDPTQPTSFFISQSVQFYEQETENKFDRSVTKHVNDKKLWELLVVSVCHISGMFSTDSSFLRNGIYSHENVSTMK
jgi:hypothetical protein